MKKTLMYHYLGTNGTIISPVHLEDTFYVRYYNLAADEGKVLTNGERTTSAVSIPEEELENWSEIVEGQN